jgi:hypothetical protein
MSSVDAERFFEDVWTQIAVAERAAGEVSERWFKIAGLTLKLRLLGSTLEPYVAAALEHLEIAGPQSFAHLTLHCWDCGALAINFPTAPVGVDAFTPRGEVRGLNNRRFHTAFDSGGRQLSLFDVYLRQAVYCVGAAATIPRFEIAEPIRAILSWFMRENGRQLIHAAAVGEPDGGVLIIGRSGAGKSNTALGCLTSNLRYAADDFCAVSTEENPKVYSIYCTGKTHEFDWFRHPFLASLSPNLDPERREKAIYFLSRTCPDKLISEFPLKAILLPRRGETTWSLRPISRAAALRLTAPDTARLLPDAGAEVMWRLAELVRKVPCYELSLGSNPASVPKEISALLRGGPALTTPIRPQSHHCKIVERNE